MNNLFSKYHITKNDGSPVDPKAQYFVLRIDTDFAARAAVLVYAMCIEKADPDFANELRSWIHAQNGAVEHTLAGGLAQWSCECGYMNVGSFCSKCGSANPQAAKA